MSYPGSGGPTWPESQPPYGQPGGQQPPPDGPWVAPTEPAYGQSTQPPTYGAPPGEPPYGQPGPPQYGQPPPEQPPYGPPPYDQPPYEQPPYDQPPSGQPPYGQPPYGGGYGPPSGGSNAVRIAILVSVAVLVLAGGIVSVILLTRDSGSTVATSATPSAPGPATTSNDFPSPSTSGQSGSSAAPTGSGTAPAESDARTVVERYFADINKKDRTDAETLICSQKQAQWRASIDGPTGDFTVTIAKYTFTTSSPGSAGEIVLAYDITASKGSATNKSKAQFTLISEGGTAKICGESS